jgi:hypothetical protein
MVVVTIKSSPAWEGGTASTFVANIIDTAKTAVNEIANNVFEFIAKNQ